jgi:hypothetical protein
MTAIGVIVVVGLFGLYCWGQADVLKSRKHPRKKD